MSYNQAIGVDAAADLSAKQYLAVGVDGNIAGTVLVAFGVLQNKPLSGEDASVVYAGRTKFKAGGAVTAGAMVGVNSTGYGVVVTSGSPNIGKAITAAGSGGVFQAIVNFASVGATA